MPRLLLSAALMLSLAACSGEAAVACNVAADALLGDWQRSGDSGAFEQFSLAEENGGRRFDSWLHERPEVAAGSWTFEPADCGLAVASADRQLQWHFRTAIDTTGGELTLSPLDAGSGTADARYRRLTD